MVRIAFDLDDTLIPCDSTFPIERPGRALLGYFLDHEPLRRGTTHLLQYLKQSKCEVWIYTTSHRSPWYLRRLFFLYGTWLGGVVNGDIHRKRVQLRDERRKHLVKYPPAFGIDLLIDDSEAVWQEGKRHQYPVLLIRADDVDWTEKVMTAVETKRRRD